MSDRETAAAPAGWVEATARLLLQARDGHSAVVEHVVTALRDTSLAGIDSHGFALLPRILKRVEAGRSQLQRPVREVHRQGGVVVLEADLAPGQHAAMAAMEVAIEAAKAHGVGFAAVNNSTHFGACYPYLKHAADAGMVALSGSNSLRSMAAFGAQQANLGNNPFGFVAPNRSGPPLLFDFSCGVMSFGARKALLEAGKEVPKEAFMAPKRPDLDDAVYEVAGNLSEVALPFGGFKGASVAVMVEVLAALLSGGAFGKATETTRNGAFRGPSHFALAFSPKAFGDGELEARLETYLADLRGAHEEVRLPGDRAASTIENRAQAGIPVSTSLMQELESWANTLSVSLPAM